MTTTIDSHNLVESLVSAITALSLEEKQKIVDIVEQQIFEAEEANYEEDADTADEIKTVKAAYQKGEYDTYEAYMAGRSTN